MNILDQEALDTLAKHIQKISADAQIKGVILATAKADFLAGVDLEMIGSLQDPVLAKEKSQWIKALFRKLECLPKPVVACLQGTALGGGIELALSCHCRLALASDRRVMGLPEVTLGLLPGAGGTQRLIRLIGLEAAMPLLVEGKKFSANEAKAFGFVQGTFADPAQMREAAISWIRTNPAACQPWDKKNFRWPAPDPLGAQAAQLFMVAPAMVNQKTWGNSPAALHILSCMYEGSRLDFERACIVESEYFAKCVVSVEAKNLMQCLWTDLQEIKKGGRRPKGIEKQEIKKVGVVGTGMMGAGIAYSVAAAGAKVVLLDVDLEKAKQGKAYSQQVSEKLVARGSMSPSMAQELLLRIDTTSHYESFADCDLVIEAVFEDRALKMGIYQRLEAILKSDAIVASNTSTLPISGLSASMSHPERFIGLHFFSPVERMQLVEIIAGRVSSPTTIARSFDFVQQIDKIPILVNDSRGFYTSRCFKTFVLEGLALLAEGQNPVLIEKASRLAGMPVGPLALTDELNHSLLVSIHEQTKKDLATEGHAAPSELGYEPLYKMIELGRSGRKSGAGFYDYQGDGTKRLWPGLRELFPRKPDMDVADMIDRLIWVQSLEALRCMQENVVLSSGDANIGSLFGWGFPAHRGGAIQFVQSLGKKTFLSRASELADRYGPRFLLES
jgi:3-hydroxyacyl-CoA dehydrogenase/enoyl-CoA hydratase/3-hydroxybutyryl-CoA epimerase